MSPGNDQRDVVSERYYIVVATTKTILDLAQQQTAPSRLGEEWQPDEKERCLECIAELWTDMRPASLRRGWTAVCPRRSRPLSFTSSFKETVAVCPHDRAVVHEGRGSQSYNIAV